jgi:LETM1 and EF-hand domain-containing protein 1
LLLSRTLYLPETLDTASQIAAAVSVLPETAATGAKAKLGEWEGKIENVTRLELIRCVTVNTGSIRYFKYRYR